MKAGKIHVYMSHCLAANLNLHATQHANILLANAFELPANRFNTRTKIMRLKRLTLQGYKTFASKTEFVFDDGGTRPDGGLHL